MYTFYKVQIVEKYAPHWIFISICAKNVKTCHSRFWRRISHHHYLWSCEYASDQQNFFFSFFMVLHPSLLFSSAPFFHDKFLSRKRKNSLAWTIYFINTVIIKNNFIVYHIFLYSEYVSRFTSILTVFCLQFVYSDFFNVPFIYRNKAH